MDRRRNRVDGSYCSRHSTRCKTFYGSTTGKESRISNPFPHSDSASRVIFSSLAMALERYNPMPVAFFFLYRNPR